VAAVAARGLVGVVAVALVAHRLNWGGVWAAIRRARLDLLGAVIALNALMLMIRTARLQLLLAPARASFGDLFLAVLTSSALNNVFPLRAGDVARLYMLESCAGISKSTATAIAVVEKLLEVAVLAALGLLATCFAPEQSWALGAGAVALGVAVGALAILRRTTDAGGIGGPGFIRTLAARIAPGISVLRSSGATAEALGASLGAWTCEIAMIMLCARAIGLTVGPVLAVVVLLGINLAISVPALPAAAGTFESAAAVILVLARVGKPAAVAFAVLYHVVQVVPVTAAGLAVLARRGPRLRSLTRRSPAPAGFGP
jgi:glycosyltransferase AglD